MPISRKIYYEYAYPQSVFHDASAYSNAVVDDSYEIQHQSRGRDHRLLSQMNDALVSTQTHRSPKAAVAALRAGRSKAEAYDYGGYEAYRPLPIKISRHPKTIEVPVTSTPYYVSPLARYARGRAKRVVLSKYRPYFSKYRPYYMFLNSGKSYYNYLDDYDYDVSYPLPSKVYHHPTYTEGLTASRPLYRLRYHYPGWRYLINRRNVRSEPDVYYRRLYPIQQSVMKALLVGEDKLSDPDRRRKPRKRYYAGKPHRDLQENLSILGIPDTSYLKASKPFDPTPSYGWKAIRDVEGYTKPKNVMSWQYRLDSHLEPEDLTYKPATYGKMRDQVRDVQDKMDRHRQLLDRYADRATLDTGYGEEIAAAGRATEEVGSGEGINKVSPLRKKLRKVICKARHDPSYYDD